VSETEKAYRSREDHNFSDYLDFNGYRRSMYFRMVNLFTSILNAVESDIYPRKEVELKDIVQYLFKKSKNDI